MTRAATSSVVTQEIKSAWLFLFSASSSNLKAILCSRTKVQGACREGQLTLHGDDLRYENGRLRRRNVICEKLAGSGLLQAMREGTVVGVNGVSGRYKRW